MTRENCVECAEFYTMNEGGKCIVENGVLDLLSKSRTFLNLVKRRGLKTIFVALDDLWLYNFHKINYDGSADAVFKTIKFVEDKQWEIVGL